MPGGIHPPLAVILAWPKPNYINPETRPNTVTILACILGPITIGLLFVRLWVRIIHQRTPGWDDWLMLAATAPTILLTVLFPIASSTGFDRHIWDLNLLADPERIVLARKYILATECVFCVASGLIKISILLFYRRLSSRVSQTFRWATWISIGFIVAYSIALTLAPILGCQPVSAFWDQVNATKILKGYKFHCFDEGADVVVASIISAAQDFITAILPSFLYWNLKIPIRQKVALFGIFAIGYGVVALGALRAYYSWRTFYDTYDVTWSTWDSMLTMMLELHIGALCANAPSLKLFFKHFFHEKLTSRSRKRTPLESDQRRDSALGYAKKLLPNLAKRLPNNRDSRKHGYIHDTLSDISVDDAHDGVHIARKSMLGSHSLASTSHHPSTNNRHMSTDTTDLMYHQYNDEDIELGRYTTDYSSRTSSLRSSKTFEGAHLEARPPSSLLPTAASRVPFQETHAQSPAISKLPQEPQPVVGAADTIKERRLTPYPLPSAVQTKPSWQAPSYNWYQ